MNLLTCYSAIENDCKLAMAKHLNCPDIERRGFDECAAIPTVELASEFASPGLKKAAEGFTDGVN
jgi:hypothetical protein